MNTATETKERPILFNAEMVRAILNGRKTQTRRVVKNPERMQDLLTCQEEAAEWCPYGRPGDRLWVRETFQVLDYCAGEYGGQGEAGFPLKSIKPKPADGSYCVDYAANGYEEGPWRPSIHMPRWASRITLEVTGVRVEQVQSISGFDARAEGYPDHAYDADIMHYGGGKKTRKWFRDLWDSINGKRGYGWEKNPYAWVVEFWKCEPAK